MYSHQRIADQQIGPLPTERSEGGRERGERCRWQEERPERVAAVEKIEDLRKPEDFFGHRNSKTDCNIIRI